MLTIILIATAFMFIISDNLPKVQYNTAIDRLLYIAEYHLPGAHGHAALSVVPGLSFIRDGPVWWNTRLVSAFVVVVVTELLIGQACCAAGGKDRTD